jgi:hypothetical protein
VPPRHAPDKAEGYLAEPARGSAAFGKLKPFSGPAQHESQRIVAAHFVRFRTAKKRSGDDRVSETRRIRVVPFEEPFLRNVLERPLRTVARFLHKCVRAIWPIDRHRFLRLLLRVAGKRSSELGWDQSRGPKTEASSPRRPLRPSPRRRALGPRAASWLAVLHD